MDPYLDSGRNLTGDNWFTSLERIDELRNRCISYIGTVRHNNRGLPQIAKKVAGRVRKDTRVFYNSSGCALVSFWDKGNKPVLLFDSMHRNVQVPPENVKPISVVAYNESKSGVDVADKKMRGYTCKRKCRRWPDAVFSNVLDVISNNASIIFHEKQQKSRKQDSHYNFIKEAAYQLAARQMARRSTHRNLKPSTITALHLLGYKRGEKIPNVALLKKQTRCAFCIRKSDRKTFLPAPHVESPCAYSIVLQSVLPLSLTYCYSEDFVIFSSLHSEHVKNVCRICSLNRNS